MGYMLVAAFAYSLVPLVVALSGGARAPFMFNAWLSLGVAVGCVLFLLVSFRGVRADFALILDRLVLWPGCGFLLLACGGLVGLCAVLMVSAFHRHHGRGHPIHFP